MPDKAPTGEDKSSEESILDELKGLQSEHAQLVELEELESGYSQKLVDSLKQLQVGIEVTIPVSPEALGDSFRNIKRAYLASDAVVVMIDADGNTISKPLNQFEPPSVLSIVQKSTMELRRIISEKRKNVGSRVGLLEEILKELRKMEATLKPARRELEESDLIQSSISNE